MKSPLNFATSLLVASFALNGCASGPSRKTYTPGGEEKPAASPKMSLIKKAQGQYGRGEYGPAIETLNSVSDNTLKDSERSEYWNLKGLINLSQKNPASSEIDFRHALDTNLSPEYSSYYQYNLATSLQEQRKSSEALKTLNAIDVATMDQNDQRKVSALRDKITQGDHGATATGAPLGAAPVVVASPTPSPTPAVQVYHGPVDSNRVGLLLPLSGKYENFGKKVQKAIELAFQSSLDSKVKGFELIPVDSGDTVESHLAALKKLVEEEKVIAIIGPLLSKGVDQLPAAAAYYQIPLISIAQVQGQDSPSFVSCSISSKDQTAKMANYAINTRGFKRIAILAPSNKAGESFAHDFWDQVKTKGGEVRSFELYDPEVTDFREPTDKTLGLYYTEPRAKEIKDLADKRKEMNITKKTMKTIQYFELPPIIDFDAVFIADEAKTVGQIIPTFAYRNAKNLPYLGITTWNSNQLLSRAGDQADGAVFPVAFNTLSPPVATKRFYDLYNATYNSFPGELDAIAFDAAAVTISALLHNPSSRDEFRTVLDNLGEVEGATGAIKIQDHHCSRDLALYTVKKGKFEVLPDGEKAENKEPSAGAQNPNGDVSDEESVSDEGEEQGFTPAEQPTKKQMPSKPKAPKQVTRDMQGPNYNPAASE